MPPARRGCDSRCGTLRETARSCSRCGCRREPRRQRAPENRSEGRIMILGKLLPCAAAVIASTGVAIRALPAFDAVTCNMSEYRASAGLTAAMDQNVLTVAWNGQNGSEMRTRYAVDGGQPVVRELAVRKAGGQWV